MASSHILVAAMMLLAVWTRVEADNPERKITGTVKYKLTGKGWEKWTAVANAKVTCKDLDYCIGDGDDLMCETKTGSDGSFRCNYRMKTCDPDSYSWRQVLQKAACAVCTGWDCGVGGISGPDIECKIEAPSDLKNPMLDNVYYTKEIKDWDTNRDLDMGTVQVYADRHVGNVQASDFGSDNKFDVKCTTSSTATGNGCGPHPRSGVDIKRAFGLPDFDFREMCHNHDCCYGTCGVSRLECDDQFYESMMSKCASKGCDMAACTSLAATWYKTVRGFGGDGYNDSQSAEGCT